MLIIVLKYLINPLRLQYKVWISKAYMNAIGLKAANDFDFLIIIIIIFLLGFRDITEANMFTGAYEV